jgi:hypothetical protein
MAIPTSYTEYELSEYMLSVTAAVSASAGLDSMAFDEAVNDVLAAYGEDDIADATNIVKLRVLAKVEAWRTVISYLMTAYDFSADGGSYKRSQMLAGAEKALERAEADASIAGYGAAYAIQMGTMTRSFDPYMSETMLEELEQE